MRLAALLAALLAFCGVHPAHAQAAPPGGHTFLADDVSFQWAPPADWQPAFYGVYIDTGSGPAGYDWTDGNSYQVSAVDVPFGVWFTLSVAGGVDYTRVGQLSDPSEWTRLLPTWLDADQDDVIGPRDFALLRTDGSLLGPGFGWLKSVYMMQVCGREVREECP